MRLCPLGLFHSHFATRQDQWPFICYHHHHSILLHAILQQWLFVLPLDWFGTSLYSRRVEFSKTRLIVEEFKYRLWRIEVFAEVPVVKAVPWGGQFLHRQCSRVARFDDIFDFGCIIFIFSSLVHSVNSPNITTLHSRCIWEGVLGYNSQGY